MTKNRHARSYRGFLLLLALTAAVIAILFHKSFVPGQALFSNDGPVGPALSRPLELPGAFFGIWNDNYWLGAYNGNYSPNFSGIFQWIVGPLAGRVTFYAPFSVLLVAVCAWLFFRRLGCSTRAAIIASLGAALNMNFFSNACWGLPSRNLALAAAFLSLAAIEFGMTVQPILTSILAGLALGLSITEGGDNGALFSMFIGAYAFWRTIVGAANRGKGVGLGAAKVVVMVVFAAIMASQTLGVFVRTSVKGVVGTEQDQQTKAQKWDFATQWSLPKLETLRVIIPGVFGYRMDTPDGGNYWGRVGEAPSAPQQMPRYSGAGEYTGILVVLIGLWALAEATRRKQGAFSDVERRLVAFWGVMSLVALLLSWGRHAPFYQFIYALPYFSTIRNPMKFMHVFNLCFMVLFAYGLLGLSRKYLESTLQPGSIPGQVKRWWSTAPAHERLWTWGCLAAIALGIVGWFGYLGSRRQVVQHLMSVGFPDNETATAIARFSVNEVLLFVVFLTASVLLLTLIISGAFSGRRANVAACLLGLVVVVDLARANLPWIIYYDWKEKYASNPVLDVLKTRPYEHRVTVMPFQLGREFQVMQQVYNVEWLQHHFPYYGVQSIDIPQEPRIPTDKQAYREALGKNIVRLWQLTNTRYLLGMSGNFIEAINQQLDPVGKRFRQHTAFSLFQKPGSQAIGVDTNAGPFALMEFTGALPRAKLYTHWEVIPDEKALLSRLADPNWDPQSSVLLMDGDAPKPDGSAGSTNATPAAATAEITENPTTKLLKVKTASAASAMLLLNDKIEPEWHAYVDGKPSRIYRANYLVRAVHLPAGSHEVTFRYEMKSSGFYTVMACDVAGLVILGIVAWSARRLRTAKAPVP